MGKVERPGPQLELERLSAEVEGLRRERAEALAQAETAAAELTAEQDAYYQLVRDVVRVPDDAGAAGLAVRHRARRAELVAAIRAARGEVDRLDGRIADVSALVVRAQARADAARAAVPLSTVDEAVSSAEGELARLSEEASRVVADQEEAVEAGDAARVLVTERRLLELRAGVSAAQTRLLGAQVAQARAHAARLVEQAHEASRAADAAAEEAAAAQARHDEAVSAVRDVSAEQLDWERRAVEVARQLERHKAGQRAAAVSEARGALRVAPHLLAHLRHAGAASGGYR